MEKIITKFIVYILISLFLIFPFPLICFSEEYCMSKETAKEIIKELKEKKLMEQEIKELEEYIINLKKQNEILNEQNKLLKEQIVILKNQVELYKVAYQEERKQKSFTIFEKGKWFGIGILSGILFGILLIPK